MPETTDNGLYLDLADQIPSTGRRILLACHFTSLQILTAVQFLSLPGHLFVGALGQHARTTRINIFIVGQRRCLAGRYTFIRDSGNNALTRGLRGGGGQGIPRFIGHHNLVSDVGDMKNTRARRIVCHVVPIRVDIRFYRWR